MNSSFAASFLDFDNGSIHVLCHKALKFLADDRSHLKLLVDDYVRLTVSPEPMLDTMKNCYRRLLWG